MITDPNCRLSYFLNEKIRETCQGKNKCDFTLKTADIFSKCPLFIENDHIFLSYGCYNKTLTILNFPINRLYLSYLIVGIDTLSVLILLIVVFILRMEYSRLDKNFMERHKLINQFTVNIKYRKIRFDKINTEMNSLLKHLDEVIRKELNIEYNRLRQATIKRQNKKNYSRIGKETKTSKVKTEIKDQDEEYPESKYDFKTENKYPTFTYEVNYPFLSEDKLRLILKKEDLIEKFISYKVQLNNIEKSNGIEYKKVEKKEKEDIDSEQDNQIDFNELNFDDMDFDNFDDFFNDNDDKEENDKAINSIENDEVKPKRKINIPNGDKIDYIKIVQKMKVIKNRISETIDKIKMIEGDYDGKVNDILVTFLEPRYATFIYNSYNKTKCSRCWTIFCCNYRSIKHLYYKDSWLTIHKNPDNPSNIKWQNMLISPTSRFCSNFISISFSIFLICCGIGIIISLKIYQGIVNKEFDSNIDCNSVTFDTQSVINEYNDLETSKRNRILTYCFCSDLLFTQGISVTSSYTFPSTTITPCKDWLNAYIKNSAIRIAITIIIPLSNGIMNLFLRLLTSYEKNKSLSRDQTSNMNKIYIAQFINTGLILLLVNINIRPIRSWNNGFPIFTGEYEDLNVGWIRNIGTTIYLALVFTIFSPIFEGLFEYLFVCIRRKCESGNMKGKGSKIKNQLAFNKIYVGPECKIDIRYGEVV